MALLFQWKSRNNFLKMTILNAIKYADYFISAEWKGTLFQENGPPLKYQMRTNMNDNKCLLIYLFLETFCSIGIDLYPPQ